MTLTDNFKILDNKIKGNQSSVWLGREAAEIPALSSKDLLEKYQPIFDWWVKNEGLKINVDGREITLDNPENLLKGLGNGILDGHEFKNRYNDIADVKAIVNKSPLTSSQNKMLETLLLLK